MSMEIKKSNFIIVEQAVSINFCSKMLGTKQDRRSLVQRDSLVFLFSFRFYFFIFTLFLFLSFYLYFFKI